jgi:acetoin utilization protein AcuB
MRVGFWMTSDLLVVEPTTPISECARLMVREKVRHLLVMERRGDGPERLAGIVSRYDLARVFPPDANPFAIDPPEIGRRIEDVMTRDVCTIDVDATIEDAAQEMLDRGVRALPVMRGGKLAGIVTLSDVTRAFVVAMGVAKGGVRVTFGAAPGETLLDSLVELAHQHGMEVSSLITLEQDGRRLGVIRFHGPVEETFIAAIRESGRSVMLVERVAARVNRGPREI